MDIFKSDNQGAALKKGIFKSWDMIGRGVNTYLKPRHKVESNNKTNRNRIAKLEARGERKMIAPSDLSYH
ncbi:hypothetical protein GCM10011350_18230 [Marinomonas arctica]|nr:hypothetical protein GCM10011350_18230 [Marinomonas arctica]